MSECIGPGCTEPGCSGKNAEVVGVVAGGTYEVRLGGPEPTTVVPNRRDRRRARKGRRA